MAFFNFFKKLFKGKRKVKKIHKRKAKKPFKKRIGKSRKKNKSRAVKKIARRKARKKVSKKPKKKAKKSIKRKAVKRKARKVKPSLKVLKEEEIGIITHYFDKISVGIIKLKKPLAISEHIRIKGKGVEFTQVISSMQYNHKDIMLAEKGLEIGIKVNQPVHENDLVYKVI
ncbi:MAG: hypothetical protein WC412_00455 [Candidatus Omnitrophota bacterium]|jgi:hypothetical protein